MKKFIFFAAGWSIAFLIVGGMLFLMLTQSYDPGASPDSVRFQTTVLLAMLSEQKPAVDAYAREHRTLDGAGSVVSFLPEFGIDESLVSSNASMMVMNKRLEIVVLLQPRLVGSEVKWRCMVIPAKASSEICRDQ